MMGSRLAELKRRLANAPSPDLAWSSYQSRVPAFGDMNDVLSYLRDLQSDYQLLFKYFADEHDIIWKKERALIAKIKAELKERKERGKVNPRTAWAMPPKDFVPHICNAKSQILYSVTYKVGNSTKLQLTHQEGYISTATQMTQTATKPLGREGGGEEEDNKGTKAEDNGLRRRGKKRKKGPPPLPLPQLRKSRISGFAVSETAERQSEERRYFIEKEIRFTSRDPDRNNASRKFVSEIKTNKINNDNAKNLHPTVRLQRLQYDSVKIENQPSSKNIKPIGRLNSVPASVNSAKCAIGSEDVGNGSQKIVTAIKTNKINNNNSTNGYPMVRLERLQYDSMKIENCPSSKTVEHLSCPNNLPTVFSSARCAISSKRSVETIFHEGTVLKFPSKPIVRLPRLSAEMLKGHEQILEKRVNRNCGNNISSDKDHETKKEESNEINNNLKNFQPIVKLARLKFDPMRIGNEYCVKKLKMLDCSPSSGPEIVNSTESSTSDSKDGGEDIDDKLAGEEKEDVAAKRADRLQYESPNVESYCSLVKRKRIYYPNGVPIIVNKTECIISNEDMNIIIRENDRAKSSREKSDWKLTKPGKQECPAPEGCTKCSRSRYEDSHPEVQCGGCPSSPSPPGTSGTIPAVCEGKNEAVKVKRCSVLLKKINPGFRGFDPLRDLNYRYKLVHDFVGRGTPANDNLDKVGTAKMAQERSSETRPFSLSLNIGIQNSSVFRRGGGPPFVSAEVLKRRRRRRLPATLNRRYVRFPPRRSQRLSWGRRNCRDRPPVWSSLCRRVTKVSINKYLQRIKRSHSANKENVPLPSSTLVCRSYNNDVNEHFNNVVFYSGENAEWRGIPEWASHSSALKTAGIQSFIPPDMKAKFMAAPASEMETLNDIRSMMTRETS